MLSMKLFAAVAFLCLATSHALSSVYMSASQSAKSRPIQRVAVIGCGIAGLTVAHALTNSPSLAGSAKQPLQVSLFDSRPALDFEAGAGIQLNGGMAVLRKINPDLFQIVKDASLAQTFVRSRAKPWNIKADTFDTLLEISLKDAVENAGGKVADELIVNGELMWFAIMRGALQVGVCF